MQPTCESPFLCVEWEGGRIHCSMEKVSGLQDDSLFLTATIFLKCKFHQASCTYAILLLMSHILGDLSRGLKCPLLFLKGTSSTSVLNIERV